MRLRLVTKVALHLFFTLVLTHHAASLVSLVYSCVRGVPVPGH